MIDFKQLKKDYKENLLDISQNEIEKGQVVLAGDCLLRYLDLDESCCDYKIYNNSICGDTTELLLETLYKRVIKYKPSTVFISIGSHDLGFDNRTVKEIYNNIVDIIKEIKRRSKETKIVMITVLPVNPSPIEYINRDFVDSRENFDINMLNYYVKNYCHRSRIKFIDAHKLMKNDVDQLNLNYTTDGFHLNKMGYQILKKQLIQKI
jgi:lysophospholipase L1-like esterase